MIETKKVPNSFLENTNMINAATTYIKSNKDISNINTLYNKNLNYFSFNKDNNNNFNNQNTLNINNKLNANKKFGWKYINNLNYNEFSNDEKILENPVIKNILNSNIDEKEIQNMPENYLVNLIHTLQGLANNAIKNKNKLELENKKLYQNLEEMKNNNDYLNQNNINLNQKILTLNKNIENIEQEKVNNNNMYNNYYIKQNEIYKKKYYCHICSNKKFKSQYYLDEHIKRRHPSYQQNALKEKNIKENKINIELYQKKLNEMKKYYDLLIYKSMKKIQYIKINEKLNSLQNLFEMSKLNFINNINMNYINVNIDQDVDNNSKEEIEDNNNINSNYSLKGKEKKSDTERSNKLSDDVNNNNIINNNEESLKKIKEEINKPSKRKESLEKDHGNFIHNYYLLKKEIKFRAIKKSFETKLEDQIAQQRKKKKHKTLKNTSKLMVSDSIDEKSKTKTKDTEDKKITDIEVEKSDKENEQIILTNKKETNIILKNENNNNIDKNKKEKKEKKENNINKDEDSIRSTKQKLKLRKEKMINFSDEEEEEEDQILKKFYTTFRERDYNFPLNKKYYMKNLLPKDYNLDQNKVNNIVEEKIESKIKNLNLQKKDIQQLRTEMMKIYYEIFDIKDKYGDMYLFSYINISKMMNIKDLILDANNNNFYLEDNNFFETIKYKLANEPENSEFINPNEEYENNERESFSFRQN